MQMDTTGQCILVNLIESILQSRVEISKKQIRRFDEVNKQIMTQRHEAFDGSLQLFLKSLLIAQKYAIRQKVDQGNSFEDVVISFRLVSKRTGIAVEAQVWHVQYEQFRAFHDEDDQQQFIIITVLFEELLLFLNKQPLFSQYQRNERMKKMYMIDYSMQIKGQKLSHKVMQMKPSIVDMSHKYMKERVCQSFLLKLQCYYLPKFDQIMDSVAGSQVKQMSTIDTSNNNKAMESDNEKTHKQSMYQFYDKELDFVFLASDDQTFKNSPKNQIKEVALPMADDNEQFQLLYLSKDEQFIDENRSLLDDLSLKQDSYFNK